MNTHSNSLRIEAEIMLREKAKKQRLPPPTADQIQMQTAKLAIKKYNKTQQALRKKREQERLEKEKTIEKLKKKINTTNRRAKKERSTFKIVEDYSIQFEEALPTQVASSTAIALLEQLTLQDAASQERQTEQFFQEEIEDSDVQFIPEEDTKSKPANKSNRQSKSKQKNKKKNTTEIFGTTMNIKHFDEVMKKNIYAPTQSLYYAKKNKDPNENEEGFQEFFNKSNELYFYDPELILGSASKKVDIEPTEGILDGFKSLICVQFHPEKEDCMWLLTLFNLELQEWRRSVDFCSMSNLKELYKFPLPEMHLKYIYKKTIELITPKKKIVAEDIKFELMNISCHFKGEFIKCGIGNTSEICAVIGIVLNKTIKKIYLPERKLPKDVQEVINFPVEGEFKGKISIKSWPKSILKIRHKLCKEKLGLMVQHEIEGTSKEFLFSVKRCLGLDQQRLMNSVELNEVEIANTLEKQIKVITRICEYKLKETLFNYKIQTAIERNASSSHLLLWSGKAKDLSLFRSAFNHSESLMKIKNLRNTKITKILVFSK